MFIGYIRQSREKDSDISPEMQRDAIKHWASAPGKDRKVKFLTPDRDWSGKSLDRPSIREALALLRAGKAAGIVVSKLDRLTRSIRDLANLIEESRRDGWTIICLDLGGETVDFSTKSGKMMGYMTGMFSEWYLDGVTEEWAKVRQHKIAAGHHWGNPPLGYRRGTVINGKGIEQPGALVVDPEWAPVVQEVFAQRARANGSRVSWKGLQTYLNASGAPSFRERAAAAHEEREEQGSSWGHSTVGALISNRAYLGEARAGGDLMKEGAHPALVSEELFRRANRKGQSFGHAKAGGGGPMLGAGFLKCSCGCGGTLYRKRGNAGVLSYTAREPGCVGNSIGAVKAEAYVVAALIAELHRKEKTGGGIAAHTGGNPEVEQMTARIAELDAEEAETDAAVESGDLSRVEAGKIRTAIARERDLLVEALAEVGPVDEPAFALVPAAHVEKVLPGMAPADVGAILRAAFSECTVSPAGGVKNLPTSSRVKLVARS